MLPNFIIAGATRSGTTSLHHYLASHEDVFVSSPKELNFFHVDTNYKQGIQAYAEHFSDAGRETAIGEATPAYFLHGRLTTTKGEAGYVTTDDDAPIRIKENLPGCRIILTLRNPVDRLYSGYWKNLFQGKIGAPSFDNWVRDQKSGFDTQEPVLNVVYANRYDIHLAHWFDLFGTEQVKVMIFEEWTRNTNVALKEVCNFLQIDPDGIDTEQFRVLNTASHYKPNPRGVKRLLTSPYVPRVVKGVLRKLAGAGRTKYPPMKPETRQWLLECFEPTIRETEKLLDTNLDEWRQ